MHDVCSCCLPSFLLPEKHFTIYFIFGFSLHFHKKEHCSFPPSYLVSSHTHTHFIVIAFSYIVIFYFYLLLLRESLICVAHYLTGTDTEIDTREREMWGNYIKALI